MSKPSVNGPNGRNDKGRFVVGNSGGPGNPHVRRTSELRNALLNAVNTDS